MLKLKKALVLGCALAMVFGCSDGDGGNPGNGSGRGDSSAETLRVGALLPMTGALAEHGLDAQAAVNLAVEDVNSHFAAGGSDIAFDVVYADTATDPDVALSAMEELHADGITTFVGGPLASQVLAHLSNYIAANNLLMINSGSTERSLARPDDNIFRVVAEERKLAEALREYAVTKGITAIAPIFRDDIYGRNMVQRVRDLEGERAVKFAADIAYPTDLPDFNPYINRLLESVQFLLEEHAPEHVLVYSVTFNEIEALFSRLWELEGDVKDLASVRWFGSDGNYQLAVLLKGAAGAFADKVGFTAHGVGFLDLPEAKRVIAILEERTGNHAHSAALSAYDAFWLFAHAYSFAHSMEVDRLKGVISTVSQKTVGVTGTQALNEAGDRLGPIVDFRKVCGNDGARRWERVGQFGVRGFTDIDTSCSE